MEGRAHHNGLRLAVETSILVLLMGGWLWGIVTLGAYATAAQGPTLDAGGSPESAVVSCPAPREPEEDDLVGAAVASDVCRLEPRLDAGTSRRPGRGLASSGHAREPVERIPEKPLSGRSLQN